MLRKSPTPLLFLDVDGVLQPVGTSVPPGFERIAGIDSEVVLRPEHGRWVNELALMYDIVWATTWGSKANPLIGARLGLPFLPHLDLRELPRDGTRKLGAIAAFAGQRAAAWIDDELYEDANEWARQREAPTLLIRPAAGVGLQRSHVDRLISFARSL